LPNKIAFKSGSSDQDFNYWLYDFNAKINHTFSKGGQLFASVYRGKDYWKVFQRGTAQDYNSFGLNWGNTTGTIRYTQPISPKLFAKVVGLFSRYQYGVNTENIENKASVSSFSSESSIKDFTLKAGFDWFPNNQHDIKFGAELTRHLYRPSFIETTYKINADSLSKINRAISAIEQSTFVEDDFQIRPWLRTNIGLRGVLFNNGQKTFGSLEPRVSINVSLPNAWILKTAYNQMNQFIHLLSSNGVGFPNDMWVPVTASVPSQRAIQWSAGISKYFDKPGIEISVEVYQKTMNKLIDYRTGTNFLANFNQSWETLIERNGEGKSQGLEVFINKTKGNFKGWISYTLAKNERRFANINQGNWYDAPYNQRHTVAITGTQQIGSDFSIAGTWSYHSGQATTVPVAVLPNMTDVYDKAPILLYGNRNNFQMPDFHRLDLSFNFSHLTKNDRRATWTAGVMNAYNQKNPFYIDINTKSILEPITFKRLGIDYQLVQVAAFPVLPYVSYSLKF
jgi:hypothetical protein